jgi:hypothetical protein
VLSVERACDVLSVERACDVLIEELFGLDDAGPVSASKRDAARLGGRNPGARPDSEKIRLDFLPNL